MRRIYVSIQVLLGCEIICEEIFGRENTVDTKISLGKT
jgi:hypothetical protein